MNRRSLLLVGLGALGLVGAAAPDGRAELIRAINRMRKKAGLGALTPDARLDQAASRYAAELAARGRLDHLGRDGSTLQERLKRVGYGFSLAAENLASGSLSPAATLALWMESPGHRHNLLLPGVTQAGIGLAEVAQPVDIRYWALLLAAPA